MFFEIWGRTRKFLIDNDNLIFSERNYMLLPFAIDFKMFVMYIKIKDWNW